ncbi:hypothetical protein [Citreimonas sp.]|uniref:hypothetical protein n=1 Tax=Citreimonas sp. TaxID=3036715 RepID=UPI00405880C3
MSRIIAIHREPFSTMPRDYFVPAGETLEQMARRVTSLPDGWPRHGGDAICINGKAVPRALWGMVRPKPSGTSGVPVEVTFHAPPTGGDGGGKQVFSIIASIALLAIAGPLSSTAFTSFANAGLTVSRAATLARLVGAAVVIGGSAILQALAPTPTVPRPGNRDSSGRAEVGSASISGNILEPNAPLPRVVGTRKVFPPFVSEPLVYFDGQDEVVEAAVALAGPHSLTNIRVGDVEVEEAEGIEFETREGWPGNDPLVLLTRYGRTIQDGNPIRGHTVNPEAEKRLQSTTGNILDAIPQSKTVATRNAPDEFWMGLQFPQGLSRTGSQEQLDQLLRVPFRIRIRARGEDAWVNLPEIHFQAAILGPKRATIKLVWRKVAVGASSAAPIGWVEARSVSPGQTLSPATDGWIADDYFRAGGAGEDYVTSSNAGTTDVVNVIIGEDVAEFQLDVATFPKGIYEVEITRGYAFREQDYSTSSYLIGGSVRDPFFYEAEGAETIYQSKKNLVDEVVLLRSNSVWNETPVLQGDTALIAIRARNTRVDRISALASGYVKDWDAVSETWSQWTTTSDPAPHLRDAFVGLLNATPLPEQVIDEASLLEWRNAGWVCNAIVEGQSVSEAATVIAGTGYAQFYQSEKFGVVRDRDRSADAPVQIFTPQNTSNFSWSRGYPKLPDGFRATFVDAAADYEPRQIIHPPNASRTEQISIEGIVEENAVRTRLQYDLDSARIRSAFYSWDAASEAIKCRRGSLVGVASDVLSSRVFTGRIADFDFDANDDVVSVRLENEPVLDAEPTWADIDDLSTVSNMALIGATFGIAIRRRGEVVTTHEVTGSARGADWVDLVTPAELPGLDYGDISAVGPLGREYRRLIVVDMVPRSLTEWTLTAVAEAPELWQ